MTDQTAARPGDTELISLSAPLDLALTTQRADFLRRNDDLRTVVYLMLFRVALATLLLVGVVTVTLTSQSPERLDGPFGRFVLSLIAATYLVSIVYALFLRTVRRVARFVYLQSAVDLLLISVLVHATGGADSGYTFLYLVDIIAMALLPSRNGVLWVATGAAICLVGTALAGYWEWLPPVPGQTVLPWDLTRRELLFRLVVNFAGVVSIAALGYALAAQTRKAGERLIRHERFAGDLASLHENIIRSLSSGLITTNQAGVITSINHAAADILGVQRSLALGQPITHHIPAIASLLETAGPVGQVHRRELDSLRPDGVPRRLGVSTTPLTDRTGSVIGRIIHFQDLTELHRMEQAVQRSERLAGIGRLAAGIAHEIRNPLASISGSVEMLRDLSAKDTDTQQLAEIVIREVDRLNQLITSLLDYTRPPTEQWQTIDLSEIVRECVLAFRHGPRRSEVRTDGIISALCIRGTDSTLRQLMWNLLRNADEAMPAERTADNYIDVSLAPCQLADGPGVELNVRDNGIGIPAEHLEHVFEPFFTQGKAGGTGLGLAMVARVVADHGGTIDVKSRPGEGTTFTVRLPAR